MRALSRVAIACIAGWSLLLAVVADGAIYPDRPVRFLVGVAPGGVNDVVTRLIGNRLAEIWGQPVVIENRTGAEGTIAAETVARAVPDGYSLVVVTSAHTMIKSELKISYDPIKSFTPVTFVGMQPQILVVNQSVPVNSVSDLIKLSKSKPGGLNFGSGGQGTPTYLAMALFMKQTGTQMVNVNYRGGAPTLVALLGGEIQLMFGSITVLLDQVKAGKVRTLAVSSRVRFAGLPDVPTVEEAGNLPGFEVVNWFGVLAPAGTPRDIVAKLHGDTVSAINSPSVQKVFSAQGTVTIGGPPNEFAKMMAAEVVKWRNF